MIFQMLLSMCVVSAAVAQSLSLQQSTVGETDEIEISVLAQLDGIRASGVSFYVALPIGAFEVLRPERPFVQGPLLAPAVEFINEIMPTAEAIGVPADVVLLPYAAVRGAGADRGRTGEGIVARFSLRPLRAGASVVRLISTPIYEAKLVLDDGIGERVFQDLVDIELGVGGAERDKPVAGGNPSWGQVKANGRNH